MNEKTTGEKNNPTKCETSVCCKATAALNKSVAEDLEQEDKNLQELLNDQEDKTQAVRD